MIKAIEVLKAFEKKDPTLQAMAATNLSFLYFLEADYVQADKYSNLGLSNYIIAFQIVFIKINY